MHVTFVTELPMWVFIMIGILGILLVVWTLPHGRVNKLLCRLLLVCRIVVMAVGVLILARPTWTRVIQSTHPDIVPVLLDTSASMSIIERGQVRFDEMVSVAFQLQKSAEQTTSDEHRRIDWFTFSDEISHPPIDDDGTILLESPEGGPTLIGSALLKVLDGLDGDRVAGVVLCSDGWGEYAEAEALLRRIGAGVWVIPIGDPDPPPNINIKRVDAPQTAFSEDRIPIRVVLQRDGVDTGDPVPVVLRVMDEIGGAELVTAELSISGDSSNNVILMIDPDIPGLAQWRADVWAGDRLLDSTTVEVDIRDRPLRLLYVEGRPRFLYRFLVPLFTREQSIDVSILLQSADQDAAPVGDHPIRRFPDNTIELKPFDLIIFGDVDPSGFTEGQLDTLRSHLLDGAGLLWVPGSNTDPDAWHNTPLETLLPVSPTTSRHVIQAQLMPVPEGEALGLPPPVDEPLAWAVAVDDHRPQARVLMQMIGDDGLVWPAFLLMPTGQGHAGWLATDDLWRWRRVGDNDHGGSLLLGMIRLLARQVAPQVPILRVIPHPVAGQPTTIVLEGAVVDEGTPTLEVSILDADGVLRQRVHLQPEQNKSSTSGVPPSQGMSWRCLWQPESSGVRHLTITLGEHPIQQEVFVRSADAEDMRPGVNTHVLETLAQRTGGEVMDLNSVSEVLKLIPGRSTKSTRLLNDGPMAPWLLWGVLVALLATEWGVRRWNALA